MYMMSSPLTPRGRVVLKQLDLILPCTESLLSGIALNFRACMGIRYSLGARYMQARSCSQRGISEYNSLLKAGP